MELFWMYCGLFLCIGMKRCILVHTKLVFSIHTWMIQFSKSNLNNFLYWNNMRMSPVKINNWGKIHLCPFILRISFLMLDGMDCWKKNRFYPHSICIWPASIILLPAFNPLQPAFYLLSVRFWTTFYPQQTRHGLLWRVESVPDAD